MIEIPAAQPSLPYTYFSFTGTAFGLNTALRYKLGLWEHSLRALQTSRRGFCRNVSLGVLREEIGTTTFYGNSCSHNALHRIPLQNCLEAHAEQLLRRRYSAPITLSHITPKEFRRP